MTMLWPHIRRGSIYGAAASALLSVFAAFGAMAISVPATGAHGLRALELWHIHGYSPMAIFYEAASAIFLLIACAFAFRAFAFNRTAPRLLPPLLTALVTIGLSYLALLTF